MQMKAPRLTAVRSLFQIDQQKRRVLKGLHQNCTNEKVPHGRNGKPGASSRMATLNLGRMPMACLCNIDH
jgi:hypothetical protein